MTVVVDFGVNCAVLAVKDAVVASRRVPFKYRWMASLIRCDAPFEVTAPVTLVDCDVGALLLIDETKVVADGATLVGTVVGCIEVCVVCLHSKEHDAPAKI